MRKISLLGFALTLAGSVGVSMGVELSPYLSTDANTLHLYHFDETAGSLPAGNPFNDAVGTLHLTNTGGLAGRDGSSANGNGYGGLTYSSAFGSSFDVLRSGDLTYHIGTSGSSTGGGANSAVVAQTALQGANGAFTYEALVYSTVNFITVTPGEERSIITHDGAGTNRGFQLRTDDGRLNFYTGATSLTSSLIPTTGDHKFEVDKWYHVAVTYDGNANVAGNFKFYWTALDSGVTEAVELGSATLAADIVSFNNNLGIGTLTRTPYRFEWQGFIDEVRISDIARGPDEFILAPEPASLGTVIVGGFVLLARRRLRVR